MPRYEGVRNKEKIDRRKTQSVSQDLCPATKGFETDPRLIRQVPFSESGPMPRYEGVRNFRSKFCDHCLF